jgi:hypothetical protein
MKKLTFFFLTLFLIFSGFFYAGKQAIKTENENNIYNEFAKVLPNDLKNFIKKNFFKKDYYDQIMKMKDEEIEKLVKINEKKNKIILNKYKKIYYNRTHTREYTIGNNFLKSYYYQTYFLSNPKNEYAVASGYMDIFEDYLIIASADGIFFKILLKDFSKNTKKNNEFFGEKISTNFEEIVKTEDIFKKSFFGIKDILIHSGKIFVTYSAEVKENCFNTGILVSDFNLFKKIKFKKLNYSDQCVNKSKKSVLHSGGRVIPFSENEILLTSGDYYQKDEIQDLNSIFGKILKVNFKNLSYELISYGHRNPQGIKFTDNKDIIISTEHGPIGGDEVNIINLKDDLKDRNFGWPIASYGVGRQETNSSVNFEKKNYKSHDGFKEPLVQFTPSIGISEVVLIPSLFLDTNDNPKFFISSLGNKLSEGDLSLHYLETNREYNKALKQKILPVYERIRDIIYYKKFNYFILFLESDNLTKGGPSIAILFNETK